MPTIFKQSRLIIYLICNFVDNVHLSHTIISTHYKLTNWTNFIYVTLLTNLKVSGSEDLFVLTLPLMRTSVITFFFTLAGLGIVQLAWSTLHWDIYNIIVLIVLDYMTSYFYRAFNLEILIFFVAIPSRNAMNRMIINRVTPDRLWQIYQNKIHFLIFRLSLNSRVGEVPDLFSMNL